MPYDIIIGRDTTDKAKFGDRGLINLGRGYVKMGLNSSLSNNIKMDIARSHVILVAGKRGSGKCLHEDTLITLADGSQIPIKYLENNKEKIISLNEQLKIEQSEKSDFFSRITNRLFKIKLRSGKEIKLTPEHPLLTIKGWKEAQSLTIGSRIATPRKICSFGNKEMPEHEIKLLAYLIAEGHTKKVVLFSNSDEKIVEEFRESLNKFDSTLKLIKEKENHYRISSPEWENKVLDKSKILFNKENRRFDNGSKIILEKRSIRKLIEREELFNLLAPQKYLSQNIMQLNKKHLSIFLNRLFSCDGSIYKSSNYWQISYSSSSNKMIRQVQNLLLRFGILSKLRDKNINLNGKQFKAYELVINSPNALKFIYEIGFFGVKEEKQKVAEKEILSKNQNPNIDTIPQDIWELYKPKNWTEIGRQLGYSHPKAMRERIHYSPSRQTLMQIAQVEQSNPLMLLAQSDIFWDEIISIELLEGEFTVYDICVPTNHNFVANDIIVHNSYTLGVIAEELSNLPSETAKNISSLIFDTMGIFWTMKYKNQKDAELLDEWNLESKELPVRIFIPYGKAEDYLNKSIPFDETFALKASELTSEDWISLFNLKITSLEGVLIENVISNLAGTNYTIKQVIEQIRTNHSAHEDTKKIVSALFEATQTWGIFSLDENGTEINNLVSAGVTTVIDVSVYSSVSSFNIRALVLSLITKKLFKTRMDARKKEELISLQHGQDYLSYSTERENPLVWIFIDEAHEFLPKEGSTPATEALVQLLREGRQPGISLVLATQQPGQIHHDAISQSDIVISHRVTSKSDLEALNAIMQSYVLDSIKHQMDDLPSLKGSAIILDDNSERIYPARIRPRFTWHGGEAPTAVKGDISL
ncbi:MAG: LAGLIDADG family homing endonuclease [Nanoarchaeota archaeon]